MGGFQYGGRRMPFKKVVGWLTGLAFLVLCCAAAQAQETRYIEYGFSFQPPAGWQEDRAASGDVRVQYLGPRRNDRSQAKLNLTTQNYAVNLSDQQINAIADEMVANSQSLGWRDPQVTDRRKLTIGGIEALQMDMTFNQDRVPTRLRHLFVPVAEHKRTYVFTFVDTAANFDETAPAAVAAINSFSPAVSRSPLASTDATDASESGLPRWALITIAALALIVIITAAYFLMRKVA
jgi:hypothetical protein